MNDLSDFPIDNNTNERNNPSSIVNSLYYDTAHLSIRNRKYNEVYSPSVVSATKQNDFNSKINVVLLNARDLRTKLPHFHSEIFVGKDFPHIVCVTETWLKSSTPNSIFYCQDQYEIYRCDRPKLSTKSKGGGVAIFVRKDLKSHQIDLELKNSLLEFVSVNIKCNGTSVNFCCLYKPSVKSVELLKPMKDILKFLIAKKQPLVLMGDFNLPGISWDPVSARGTHKQPEFLNAFLSNGLKQIVTEPTRKNA